LKPIFSKTGSDRRTPLQRIVEGDNLCRKMLKPEHQMERYAARGHQSCDIQNFKPPYLAQKIHDFSKNPSVVRTYVTLDLNQQDA